MSEFFAMGGYAAYVWPAYAIAFLAIFILIAGSFIAHGRAKRALAQFEGRKG